MQITTEWMVTWKLVATAINCVIVALLWAAYRFLTQLYRIELPGDDEGRSSRQNRIATHRNIATAWLCNWAYVVTEFAAIAFAFGTLLTGFTFSLAALTSYYFHRASVGREGRHKQQQVVLPLVIVFCGISMVALPAPPGVRISLLVPLIAYSAYAIVMASQGLVRRVAPQLTSAKEAQISNLLVGSLIIYAAIQPLYLVPDIIAVTHGAQEKQSVTFGNHGIHTLGFALGFAAKLTHLAAATMHIWWRANGIAEWEASQREERRGLEEKKKFLSQMAHELRTPTALLRLCGDNLESAVPGRDRMHLHAMITAATRIDSIVSGTWFFLQEAETSNLGHDTLLEKSRRKLTHIVEQAYIAVKTTIKEERGDKFQVTLDAQYVRDAWVLCSPTRMVQVFVNLFKNSCEAFDSSGGRIHVRMKRSKDNEMMEMLVADDGPGIRPELRDLVFQGGFTTKEGLGHGHGLQIVRDIIEEHGGRVRCAPDEGPWRACFFIEIPGSLALKGGKEQAS